MTWRENLRVVHWGPLLALFIISEITLSGLYCLLQWYPPDTLGGAIHLAIYLQWDVFILYNFLSAIYIGPGHVPDGWSPKEKSDVKYLQYCNQCESYKAPRSHHCRKCGKCVLKMDHHCPWINNCVGHRNHASFTLFVFFAPLGCLHAVCVLIPSLYRAINRHHYIVRGIQNVPIVRLTPVSLLAAVFGVSLAIGVTIAVAVLFYIQNYYILYGTGTEPIVYLGVEICLGCVFSIGLAVGVFFAVSTLFIVQMRSIIRNETGIEGWIKDKAEYRDKEEDEPEFVYPYDLGKWKNFRLVLHLWPRRELDGIWWPVIEGADQYTFTREQIAQKKEKKERMVQYVIQRSYAGTLLPITMGPRVCCCLPCTDEPRIAIAVNDKVIVSRWKRHWLYGDKVLESFEQKDKKRLRGWFPRKCAVELFPEGPNEKGEFENSTPGHCDSQNDSTNKKTD